MDTRGSTGRVRLYGFLDLLALVVAAELNARGVSVQHEALAGKVERRRGALGNKPLLAGTRVPVGTVQRYLAAGRSIEDVLEAFPMLTASDVEAVRRETVA